MSVKLIACKDCLSLTMWSTWFYFSFIISLSFIIWVISLYAFICLYAYWPIVNFIIIFSFEARVRALGRASSFGMHEALGCAECILGFDAPEAH